MHPHAEARGDRLGQRAGAQRRIAGLLAPGDDEHLVGQLVRAARPRLGRHQALPARRRPAPPQPCNTTAARTRTRPPPRSPTPRRPRRRRTISYLTCTTSRASKNSEPANTSSRTASGCAFNVRVRVSSVAFSSAPRCAIAPPNRSTNCPSNSAASIGRHTIADVGPRRRLAGIHDGLRLVAERLFGSWT